MPLTRRPPLLGHFGATRLTVAAAAAPLLAPLPAAAASTLTLAPAGLRTAVPGCDNATPVRAPSGAVYSNVSDCSPAGTRISTGWVQLDPTTRFVASNLTTTGSGRQ